MLVVFLVAWTWSELWLPGGYVPVCVASVALLMAVVLEWTLASGAAIAGRDFRATKEPKPSSLRPWAIILTAVMLFIVHVISLGPHITLAATRWYMNPRAWRAWAVDPIGPVPSRSQYRFVGPFYASMDAYPSGVVLRVAGAGELHYYNSDDGSSPSWSASADDLHARGLLDVIVHGFR